MAITWLTATTSIDNTGAFLQLVGIFVGLVVWVIAMFKTPGIARRKGRRVGLWETLVILLGVIPFVVLLILGTVEE